MFAASQCDDVFTAQFAPGSKTQTQWIFVFILAFPSSSSEAILRNVHKKQGDENPPSVLAK